MLIRLLRAPATWAVALCLAVVAGAALYWFQPWKLVTDREVNDELAAVPAPMTSAMPMDSAMPMNSAMPMTSAMASASEPAPPSGPSVVRQGTFISHEHATEGTARVVRHPDGSHTLELVGLDTSDGPDLRVWLSDQPVRPGTEGWYVFDDGDRVELGALKGNRGDQTYAIPAGTDLDALDSVAIWCIRFSVSFGAAALTPAG
ncbi:DM13 domain-containing protein [Catenuloplanes indicus]|uniref:DM13 domain-containing protein n=1 Tax=Catenuloplanes indicus TaxID=137267 RepID=A0AAE3VU82_9ACTN|nr:DM13 domain-containing protein [Catenuloplanes indicus]MDQ0363791.1 hypothetical protein [Catenuloplanes indicus]